jgi:hypothetical protein
MSRLPGNAPALRDDGAIRRTAMLLIDERTPQSTPSRERWSFKDEATKSLPPQAPCCSCDRGDAAEKMRRFYLGRILTPFTGPVRQPSSRG